MTTSVDKRSGESAVLTDDQFDAVVQDWLESFVPSETTIDGGLIPSHLSAGATGVDYASFHLAPPSLPTEETAAVRAELKRIFGAANRPKRRLGLLR